MKRASVVLLVTALTTASSATAKIAPAPPHPNATSFLTMTPEQQETWFKHPEALLPSRVVHKGNHVHPLPMADHQIDPKFTVAGKTWKVDDYMKTFRVSGLLVMRDGKILLERYGLHRRPADRWLSFSVAKSVTSLLAGAAIEDGRLKLEDPVVKWVPELKGSAYDGVTVEQLLKMSSGVHWVEEYTNPNSDIVKIGKFQAAGGDPIKDYLAKLPRDHPPGTTFHYNTAETNLAGLIITRATGQNLTRYLEDKIWKPYGMESDALWGIDKQGREIAGSALVATVRDYARIGQFVLDNGVIKGKRVLPPTWIAQSTSARIAIPGRPAPGGYGYFWWIGARAFEASGIYGQSILIYPKEHIVMVQNAAWPRPGGDDLFGALSLFQGAMHDAVAPDFPKTMRD